MPTVAVPVTESSQIAEARRVASGMAGRLGFSEAGTGRVALVATEAATNVLKHARSGEVLCTDHDNGLQAIELLALDRGPGLPDVGACLRDGYSTTGSSGTGLGAMQRLSNEFDLDSRPGLGTAVLCRIVNGTAPLAQPAVEYGAISVPQRGEEVCGDAWAVYQHAGGAVVMVADGLGHGPGAAEAALRAAGIFLQAPLSPPGDLLADIHPALRSTRGAAVSIAALDLAGGTVTYAGVGNVSGLIVAPGARRPLIGYPGTVGHEARKIQESKYAIPAGALLVLWSDGVSSHWDLDTYAGLAGRDASLIAGVLYRDFSRRRDDATVVVLRARS